MLDTPAAARDDGRTLPLDPPRDAPALPGYTLMLAGQRTAKTSLLRLIVDALDIAPSASPAQISALARFVHSSARPTSDIRAISIDVTLPLPPSKSPQSSSPPGRIPVHDAPHPANPHPGALDGRHAPPECIRLTLVDTPALEITDEQELERAVADLLGFVESKYLETLDEESNPASPDHQVHLCIYLLNPDDIVPQSARDHPQRQPPRGRPTAASSDVDELDVDSSDEADFVNGNYPPRHQHVPNSAVVYDRPTVPVAEIRTIQKLSKRVNVLPVLARSDTLLSDRLAAIKKAVLRDLANAGLGFGIFDPANLRRVSPSSERPRSASNARSVAEDGPSRPLTNGSASSTTPAAAASSRIRSASESNPSGSELRGISASTVPLLPYALMSPDAYAWGDGVARSTAKPPRDQLATLYSFDTQVPDKRALGRFVRQYRWGTVDVLDPRHCDFVPFLEAVFQHMQTLKKYTRDHLYALWKADVPHDGIHDERKYSVGHHSGTRNHSSSISYGPDERRPVGMLPMNGAGHAGSPPGAQQPYIPGTSQYTLATGAPKVRQKKILVACNFCRTRKLKCDGARPACAQCVKRGNACDYQIVMKRRGTAKMLKEEGGVEDSSAAGGQTASATTGAATAPYEKIMSATPPSVQEERDEREAREREYEFGRERDRERIERVVSAPGRLSISSIVGSTAPTPSLPPPLPLAPHHSPTLQHPPKTAPHILQQPTREPPPVLPPIDPHLSHRTHAPQPHSLPPLPPHQPSHARGEGIGYILERDREHRERDVPRSETERSDTRDRRWEREPFEKERSGYGFVENERERDRMWERERGLMADKLHREHVERDRERGVDSIVNKAAHRELLERERQLERDMDRFSQHPGHADRERERDRDRDRDLPPEFERRASAASGAVSAGSGIVSGSSSSSSGYGHHYPHEHLHGETHRRHSHSGGHGLGVGGSLHGNANPNPGTRDLNGLAPSLGREYPSQAPPLHASSSAGKGIHPVLGQGLGLESGVPGVPRDAGIVRSPNGEGDGSVDGSGSPNKSVGASPRKGEKGVGAPGEKKPRTASRRVAGSNYGPKTVACNFCRTRKTKCDGQHPKCGNCQKRSLPCEYLEDQRRRIAAAATQESQDASGAGGSGPDMNSATKLKKLAPAPASTLGSHSGPPQPASAGPSHSPAHQHSEVLPPLRRPSSPSLSTKLSPNQPAHATVNSLPSFMQAARYSTPPKSIFSHPPPGAHQLPPISIATGSGPESSDEDGGGGYTTVLKRKGYADGERFDHSGGMKRIRYSDEYDRDPREARDYERDRERDREREIVQRDGIGVGSREILDERPRAVAW